MKVTEKNKAKNKRGITLISLIVTIIVLLLLTGIPIVMMVGENGIIQKSHEAKHSVEQAEEQKDLDLKLSEYVLEKETTDVEINDFVDRLEDEGKVKDHTQNDDGSYDIETDGGYSAEVKPDPDNPGDTIVEVEGKTDELKPKITALYLSSTTNSITVRIKMNIRRKNATYNILYRPEEGEIEGEEIDEEEYKQAKTDTLDPKTYTNGDEILYTIPDLKQNTKYSIKVQAINDIGTDEQTKEITTREIPRADDTEQGIQIGEVTWNDDGTANLHVEKGHGETVDDKDIKVQYRIKRNEDYVDSNNGDEGWKDVKNGVTENLELWDEVELRYSDGLNNGPSRNTKIEDTNKPNVEITVTNTTTNSITVQTDITDGESGFDENVIYTYYIKKNTEETYSEESKKTITAERGDEVRRASNTYTFTNLEQTTNFDVKVVVQDRAKNENTNETSGITQKMPEGNDQKEGINFTNLQWNPTTHQASITASKRNTTTIYKIRYRKNEEPDKDEYTEIDGNEGTIEGLSLNDTVYAKLWDGTNYGSSATIKITDGEKPEVTVEVQEEKTSKIRVKATAQDNEAGLPEQVQFKYYIKEKNSAGAEYRLIQTNTVTNEEITSKQGGIATENTYTFEKLTQNTDYQIKVEVNDRQPNTGIGEKDGRTTGLPSASDANNGIKISNPEWNPDGTANIPVQKGGTTANDTDILIQYKIGENGEWTDLPEDKKVPNVKLGEKVHLKYIDRTNESVETLTTLEDPTPPNITITTTGTTTSTITVRTDVIDKEAGLPATITYKYYVKKQSDPNYPTTPITQNVTRGTDVKTSTNTCTFEKLDQTTTYDIKVTVDDRTPNTGTANTTGQTKTMPKGDDTTEGIQFSSITWNPTTHKASITATKRNTNTIYTIRYRIGSAPDKTNFNDLPTNGTISNLELKNVVYAELWDGTNYGGPASITITDGTAPKVEITKGTIKTSKITVTAKAQDDEAGLPEQVQFKYYIKRKTENDSAYQLKKTNTINNAEKGGTGGTATTDSYTFDTLSQSTEYTIKVEVDDRQPNTGKGNIDASTIGLPSASDGSNGIQVGDPDWRGDGNANIPVQKGGTAASDSDVKIQYKIGSDTTWHDLPSDNKVPNVGLNQNVQLRYSDGTNTGGEKTTTLSDPTAPTVTVTNTGVTTNSISVSVSAKDLQSGLPGNVIFKYYIRQKGTNTWPKETTTQTKARTNITSASDSYTFTGLTQTTNYEIKVEATDNASNTGNGTAEGTTTAVPQGSGNITLGNPVWYPNAHNATVTVSTKTNYRIRYWTSVNPNQHIEVQNNGTIPVNQNKTTVYAELWDGTNAGTNNAASITVTDDKGPTIGDITVTKTTKEIKVTTSATDAGFGMLPNPTYNFYIAKSGDSYPTSPAGSSTNGIYNFTDREHNTDYKIKVEVADYVNNKNTKETTAKTEKMPDGSDGKNGVTIANPTWSPTNHNATVVISKKNSNDGYILQYKIGRDNWTPVSSATTNSYTATVTDNTTVYARLSDGKNVGAQTTKLIKDTNPPTVSTADQETTNWAKSKKINVTATDSESGIAAYAITQSANQPAANSNDWNASNNTNWTSQIGYGAATYYVWVKDVAGNISTTGKSVVISNIDTTAPTISVNSSTTPAKKQTATITISDTQSGLAAGTYNINYIWTTSASTSSYNGKATITVKAGDTSGSVNVEKSTDTGTYYLHVQGVSLADTVGNTCSPTNRNTFELDNLGPTITFGTANNKTYAKSQKSTISVSNANRGASELDTNSYRYVWVTGTSTQAPAYPEDSKYTNAYTSGGEGSKSDGTGDNWYLTAIAKDRLGNATKAITGPFYLDNTPPNNTAPTVTASATNALSLTFTQKDVNAGINTSTKAYQYKLSTEQNWPANWTNINSNVDTVSISGLKSNTKYDVRTRVNDTLGNGLTNSLSNSATTKDITTPTINLSKSDGWTNQSITATINYPTTGLTNEYYIKTGNDISWKTATGSPMTQTIGQNCTIGARTRDASNNEKVATKQVTNIDTSNPNEATITLSGTSVKKGEKLTARVQQSDNTGGSGISISNCKWEFKAQASVLGTSSASYSNTFSSADETINLPTSTTGEYYLHVLSVDRAGNKKEKISSKVTIKPATETAKELANQVKGTDASGKGSIIGSKVTGLKTSSACQSLEWLIFDVDSENIYLISKNFIKGGMFPKGPYGSYIKGSPYTSDDEFAFNMTNVIDDWKRFVLG